MSIARNGKPSVPGTGGGDHPSHLSRFGTILRWEIFVQFHLFSLPYSLVGICSCVYIGGRGSVDPQKQASPNKSILLL